MTKIDRQEPHYGLYLEVLNPPLGDDGVARLYFLRHGSYVGVLPSLPYVVLDTPTESWFRDKVWDAVYEDEVVMFPAIDGWTIDLPFETRAERHARRFTFPDGETVREKMARVDTRIANEINARHDREAQE